MEKKMSTKQKADHAGDCAASWSGKGLLFYIDFILKKIAFINTHNSLNKQHLLSLPKKNMKKKVYRQA